MVIHKRIFPANRQNVGNWAEDLAANFLKKLGYKIIERNVRFNFGEIDIIAKTGSLLVFVEVRFRKTSAYGDPLSTIGAAKRSRLKKAILAYISRIGHTGDLRIDAIGITGGENITINHVKNIYIYD